MLVQLLLIRVGMFEHIHIHAQATMPFVTRDIQVILSELRL
jgi:hypothetical protein